MVSFDIVSLFTMIPVDEAIGILNKDYRRMNIWRKELT